MKAILWHLLGAVLIVIGVGEILQDLLGFDQLGFSASWLAGAVLVVFGAWAWVRGIRERHHRGRNACVRCCRAG